MKLMCSDCNPEPIASLMKQLSYLFLIVAVLSACGARESASPDVAVTKPALYKELYRPQTHFSPPSNWMNDPNGMVFYEGEYHLFYQHYPDSNVWGPMHWGHAISKDLVKWENQPIALYPDSLGMIFSGSAVVDEKNTSGLGTAENPPLVAMFTYHADKKAKAGDIDYQTQGIAYSVDKGHSWKKFEGNPVIRNPGIKDFRDPKVFWHDGTSQWIVVLAVQDHIEFWGSPNLKEWKKLSEFGKEFGAHGGVWECPDLFKLTSAEDRRDRWILFVSINPGGPNGGSATQYFSGDFDGKTFKADEGKENIQWLDYGPDNYAGVTFFNAPDARRIFMGWMSNWDYGEKVPTLEWRSAMTTPRDLSLTRMGKKYYVRSTLSPEYLKAGVAAESFTDLIVKDTLNVGGEKPLDVSYAIISGVAEAKTFSLELSNANGQYVELGFDEAENSFFIDRSHSGNTEFSEKFSKRVKAPRVSTSKEIAYTIVTDAASVEVFFDDGLTVMTAIFFPDEALSKLKLKAPSETKVSKLEVKKVDPIW
jgi:fructan beta-fructosidase